MTRGRIMVTKPLLISAVILGTLTVSSGIVKADTNTLTSTEHTQQIHLNTAQGWSNDVQNIVWNESGKYYDVYFLHSKDGADNPFGDYGQDWYHTTTKDFINYTKQNVAIASHGPESDYTWKSAWTGSVVVNKGDIAGVPKGAKVAYFSGLEKNDGGSQNIWAAWSDDNGKTFTHVLNNANPVIDHSWSWTSQNHADERDSSVFYIGNKLMMYTSEGDSIGVYTSKDGLNWEKADKDGASKIEPYSFFKGHSWDGNAPIECPAIRTMKMPNDKTKQVLFFGAKDASKQETTGTYYIVGHLDTNGLFAPETDATRVDQGTDFYGANVSGSDDIETVNDSLKILGWVGNWNYTAAGIHSDDAGESSYAKKLGAYSTVRTLTLNNDLTLKQSFDNPVNKKTKSTTKTATVKNPLNSYKKMSVAGSDTNGNVYNLYDSPRKAVASIYKLKFSQKSGTYNSRIFVDIWQGKDYVKLNYDPSNGWYNVKAYSSELKNNMSGDSSMNYYQNGLLGNGDGYGVQSHAKNLNTVDLKIITDKGSVEIVFPNGQSYTLARYSTKNSQDVKIYTEDPDMTTNPNKVSINETLLTKKMVK